MTSERAREKALAEPLHVYRCSCIPEYPDPRCIEFRSVYQFLLKAALTEAAAEAREKDASIADAWVNSKSCGVGGAPCEHQRLAATIAERIRKQ